MPAKFSLGLVVATAAASAGLSAADILTGLSRHVRGDWGDLDEHDRLANEHALLRGSRLFSAYRAADGTKYWIITEHDRSYTTVMLPEDY